ncbi:MAG: class I SAM-dependent methyltransferase [Nitrososphaerales archaeon]
MVTYVYNGPYTIITRNAGFDRAFHRSIYRLMTKTVGTGFWGEGDDYETLYHGFCFDEKVVLDVGADYGSTAHYFLSKGAKFIVCVECNKYLFRKLVSDAKLIGHIEPIQMCVSNSEEYEQLIERCRPQIAKVDCEGCEVYLCGVKDSALASIPEWIIETHGDDVSLRILDKFLHNGFRLMMQRSLPAQVKVLMLKKEPA